MKQIIITMLVVDSGNEYTISISENMSAFEMAKILSDHMHDSIVSDIAVKENEN